MNGAERAQEEVEAYGAQIAVLRVEIGRVLDHANFRVKADVDTRLQMPANPLYTAIVLTNESEVPLKLMPVSGPMGIRFSGDSEQVMNGTIEGNCRFNKGLLPSATGASSLIAMVWKHRSRAGRENMDGMTIRERREEGFDAGAD